MALDGGVHPTVLADGRRNIQHRTTNAQHPMAEEEARGGGDGRFLGADITELIIESRYLDSYEGSAFILREWA